MKKLLHKTIFSLPYDDIQYSILGSLDIQMTSVNAIIASLFDNEGSEASDIQLKFRGIKEIDTPAFIQSSGTKETLAGKVNGFWVDLDIHYASWIKGEWMDNDGIVYGKVKITFHRDHAVIVLEYDDPFVFIDVLCRHPEEIRKTGVHVVQHGSYQFGYVKSKEKLTLNHFSIINHKPPLFCKTSSAARATQRWYGKVSHRIPLVDLPVLVIKSELHTYHICVAEMTAEEH